MVIVKTEYTHKKSGYEEKHGKQADQLRHIHSLVLIGRTKVKEIRLSLIKQKLKPLSNYMFIITWSVEFFLLSHID